MGQGHAGRPTLTGQGQQVTLIDHGAPAGELAHVAIAGWIMRLS
jgi:hypothetical protein